MGLFNGAVGKVIEIVYKENTSTLNNAFPAFIVVDIPTYWGPAWIPSNLTWIPITPIELKCRKHCCSFKFIPLSLAYTKTGHTFQGQNVVPSRNPIYSCTSRKQGNGICIKAHHYRVLRKLLKHCTVFSGAMTWTGTELAILPRQKMDKNA